MKLGIVTLAAGEGFAERVKIATDNTQEYCTRHGYDFHLHTALSYPQNNKHYSCFKLLMVRDLLESYDWLLWLDADALIMDHRIPLERWVENTDRHFVMAPDLVHGLNCGIWFARNTPMVKGKLTEWFNMPEHPSYWEQPAVNQTIRLDTVKVEPTLQAICYLGQWHPRSRYYRMGYHWIAHLAGRRTPQLSKDLAHFAKYITR